MVLILELVAREMEKLVVVLLEAMGAVVITTERAQAELPMLINTKPYHFTFQMGMSPRYHNLLTVY